MAQGRVPRIAYFQEISIFMYHSEHFPPHFHAEYQGAIAQVRITDGRLITGSLPRPQRRQIRDWTRAHTEALLLNWARARRHEELFPIDAEA